jgi:hypothetical protein
LVLVALKHLATVEWGHFGATFDRPFAERCPGWTTPLRNPTPTCGWACFDPQGFLLAREPADRGYEVGRGVEFAQ